MKPPLLQHVRTVWTGTGGVTLAAATVQPVPGREGYWLERRDFPLIGWPVVASLPLAADARVESVRLCERTGPTLGQMVQGVFDARIATAASLAALLGRLLEKQGSSMDARRSHAFVRFERHGKLRFVLPTEHALRQLRSWRDAGLTGLVQRRNALVDAVEQGGTSHRDALGELAGDDPASRSMADAVARQIDAVCERWKGMSRTQALSALDEQSNQPPRLAALPSWMDPQERLPADHALRVWRVRMEADLAGNDPDWSVLDEVQRAQRRGRWLAEHAVQIEAQGGGAEFSAAMDLQTGRFSALRYWLTGMTQ